MTDLLPHLTDAKTNGSGWVALCPSHEDRQHSLSVSRGDRKWLVHCHAGCETDAIVAALGLRMVDLFDDPPKQGGRGTSTPPNNRATVQPSPLRVISSGLTVEQYAVAKHLPVEFLTGIGLSDIKYDSRAAVRIPYHGPTGEVVAVRFRIALDGDRFRWNAGAKPCLYGLNRISEARSAGRVIVVEGESDAHTLWFHGFPAIGIPGAANWREDRDANHLDGISEIFVVIEPDKGGETVRKWLSESTIRDRVRLLSLPTKDISALHLVGPDQFKTKLNKAMRDAVAWTLTEAKAEAETHAEAWECCQQLAQSENILAMVDRDLTRLGLVGERDIAKLVYLAVTSRLFDRPVSIALKGPSSGGKSFICETVLKMFPPPAYYTLTAMSDRSLAYSTEPIRHRHLVIYEAAGMAGDFATYLMRSLLSEGRIRYETVEKTKDGLTPKLIEREGPTGLIVTTTRLSLHPENETRLLSLTVTDTRDQTSAILRALAQGIEIEIDLAPWHALQTWIATGKTDVAVPFASALAAAVPPVAVRLRRDFRTVLQLIRANAFLHQASRDRDKHGRIVATVEDYAIVRELVADMISAGVEATVPAEVRETVLAVGGLIEKGQSEVSQADLVRTLRLDKGAVSRRVAGATGRGFLRNMEDRKGRPHRLVLADPLPDDEAVLPAPEALHGCAVDQGDKEPPPPSGDLCAHCGTAGEMLDVHGPDGCRRLHRGCVDAWAMAHS